jgi:hypothetical protein
MISIRCSHPIEVVDVMEKNSASFQSKSAAKSLNIKLPEVKK